MARYTGPTTRISRRFGQHILGSGKAFERRPFPPGVHGAKMKRKVSEYAVGLNEKQKLRYIYGLLERQFRRVFEIAKKERGVTGERFLQLLETRLDSVVYRLGFANSRNSARQLVGHGHVQVNARKVDVSSYCCKPGDVVTVKDKPASRRLAAKNIELTQIAPVPDWLTANKDAFTGTVNRIPTREELAPIVNEQLIVELYSKA